MSGAEIEMETGGLVVTNDPVYDAVLARAKVHLQKAYDEFHNDKAINWQQRPGNAPKARARIWVDALKATLAHAEEMERRL